jgi:ABC-2 type transport system ATP-binding protein
MNKGKVVLSRTRDELEEKAESLEDIFFRHTEGAPDL